MKHHARSAVAPVLAALLIIALGGPRVDAAGTLLISVKTAQELRVPAGAAPAGYTLQLTNDQPITNAGLLPLLGRKVREALHRDGWAVGFHGWLDSIETAGAPFATYDFYGFKTVAGARAAVSDFTPLVLGVRIASSDPRLPAGSQVFIDGTGTFDPNNQPFTVVEVVFQVDNVLADISGYYAGGDTNATDAARITAFTVSSALAAWLRNVAHPAQKG